ncbi:hypothetical protein JCM9140_4432 [Halalkalibacter wakoensis JCM 9140]|uniref:Uncharacterized protein n=1 Tax=Halalkalibacter wakoensis JCM 9140 TaxID=1236970 RepID=W4Q8A9_9BACI|nr:hypothetical protein [Halalkalibacter wakoensis]GAE28222.1 hypothetical protein JCM9140_4432 [Halalkalibacter wakoensis JCM 9140]
MYVLLAKLYQLMSRVDPKGYVFDKSMKWFAVLQSNSSFSNSTQFLTAAIYLV